MQFPILLLNVVANLQQAIAGFSYYLQSLINLFCLLDSIHLLLNLRSSSYLDFSIIEASQYGKELFVALKVNPDSIRKS
jgi:hypothetical protein